MKTFASLLSIALFACTAQVSAGPGGSPSRPPPPRTEPGRPVPPPATNEGWVELAPPQFNEDFRDFIKPGQDRSYKRFKLEVTRGRVHVDQVTIEFADVQGDSQKNKIGKELGAGESLNIDLEGRERTIHRIIVYVDPAQGRRDRGMYRVFAR